MHCHCDPSLKLERGSFHPSFLLLLCAICLVLCAMCYYCCYCHCMLDPVRARAPSSRSSWLRSSVSCPHCESSERARRASLSEMCVHCHQHWRSVCHGAWRTTGHPGIRVNHRRPAYLPLPVRVRVHIYPLVRLRNLKELLCMLYVAYYMLDAGTALALAHRATVVCR